MTTTALDRPQRLATGGASRDLCLRIQEYLPPRGGHVGGITPSRPHREGYRAEEKDR